MLFRDVSGTSERQFVASFEFREFDDSTKCERKLVKNCFF